MKLSLTHAVPREADARSFIFQPDGPFIWTAGQYMHYVLPHSEADDRGTERWFTISSAPSEKVIAITTRLNADRSSSFKAALQKLRPGDSVEADGPEGDFVLDDLDRNYIFIAGGIGITPFRSMLVEAAARGETPSVTLLYANRTPEIVFHDELERLRHQNPNLAIDYVVAPHQLDEALLRKTLAAANNPLVYISGPEPMVADLSKQIAGLGVSADNIRTDDFPGYDRI